MANIIKLGNRPKTFKEIPVEITLPDGEKGVIPLTFKYHDKTEFGRWQDSMSAKAKAMESKNEDPDAEPREFSWEEIYKRAGKHSADALLEVIDSWGLDENLSKEVLLQIEAECGGSAFPAMFEAFGKACREGRLGN